MKTAITALYNAGSDATDNIFDVVIELPKLLQTESSSKHLRVRCQGFTPPVFNVKTYPVYYRSITINRVSTSIEGGDREFKLEFRLDANYDVYKKLAAWRTMLLETSNGIAKNLINSAADLDTSSPNEETGALYDYGTVVVTALAKPVIKADEVSYGDSSDTLIAKKITDQTSKADWQFHQVWLSSLTEPKYKTTDTASPIMITATFSFGEFQDPYHKWDETLSKDTYNNLAATSAP